MSERERRLIEWANLLPSPRTADRIVVAVAVLAAVVCFAAWAVGR